MDGFRNSPARALATLYRQDGRAAAARKLLLEGAAIYGSPQSAANAGQVAARNLTSLIGIAQSLLEIGCPADALRLDTEALGRTDELQQVRALGQLRLLNAGQADAA